MKVKVELVVEVDQEAWELVYGVPKREQRADVKEYVTNQVWGSAAANEGGITDVKLMNP